MSISLSFSFSFLAESLRLLIYRNMILLCRCPFHKGGTEDEVRVKADF